MSRSPIQAVSGTNGRIEINGVTKLNFVKYNITPKAVKLPTTNFESQDMVSGDTFGEHIYGIKECDVTFEGAWDLGSPPYDDPPNLSPGEFLQDVVLYAHKINGAIVATFSELGIDQAATMEDVDGKLMVSVQATSNGSYTLGS